MYVNMHDGFDPDSKYTLEDAAAGGLPQPRISGADVVEYDQILMIPDPETGELIIYLSGHGGVLTRVEPPVDPLELFKIIFREANLCVELRCRDDANGTSELIDHAGRRTTTDEALANEDPSKYVFMPAG